MKIVTWNANMKFRKKEGLLVKQLDPDIAFIQECESPDKYPDEFPYKLFPFRIWKGENRTKGIAVFSKYEIRKLDEKSLSSRYYIPFKINDTFFIGIWAMNDKEKPQNRYIAQVWNILNEYHELFNKNLIILGDFNWNIIWDKKESNSLEGDFQNVNEILNKNDIESVYHHWFKEDFGREKNPTYFMFKKESKSYHTDYIFLKKNTIDNIKNFSVGKYNEWIGYSDHMPLLIEI
ncbi:MAG: endonuclease/exonuclease/phosphatase family protein [Candidatus Methanoperedens sp.]|nr:endonuclease/exonuclease/phosphatase family protein [Candidatus Methanoperedens sp.]